MWHNLREPRWIAVATAILRDLNAVMAALAITGLMLLLVMS